MNKFTQQFTDSSQDLINDSARIANAHLHSTLVPLHTLAAGINNDFCRSFFELLNVDSDELHQLVEHELEKLPTMRGGQKQNSLIILFCHICKRFEGEKP